MSRPLDKKQTMASSRVPCGIVGCGAVVQEYHLPALVQNPALDLRVLCDKNLDQAVLARQRFQLTAVTTASVADLVGQVTAALVAVPPRWHAPVTRELLEAGIDVLCEKPLALTAAEAQTMIAVAQQHGRILAVGLTHRFHPNNSVLQRLVEQGAIGEVREVIAELGAPLDWTMPTDSYYNRDATGGGVVFDTGVHLIDRVLWLFGGRLDDITYEDDSYGGVESNAVLCGNLPIGGQAVPCRFTLSWTHLLNNSIRVVGAHGVLEAKQKEPGLLHFHQPLAGQLLETLIPCPGPATDFFRVEIADFIEAVRQRREPFATATSALAALQVIERAYAVRRPLPQPWVDTK